MSCNLGQAASEITGSISDLRNTVEGIQGSARGIMDGIENLPSSIGTQIGQVKARLTALVPTVNDALDALGVPAGLVGRAQGIAAMQDPIQQAQAIAELYADYGPELDLGVDEFTEVLNGGGDLCKLLPNIIQGADGQLQKLGGILEAPEIDAVLDPRVPTIPDVNLLKPALPDLSGIFNRG